MVFFFILRTAGLVRYFEPSLRLLAERGHVIHLGFPYKSKGGDMLPEWVRQYAVPLPGREVPSDDAAGAAMLTSIAMDHPNISWGFLRQQRIDGWQEILTDLRACRDYLRYFDPAFRDATALRERSIHGGVPVAFASLIQLPGLRSAVGRWMLRGFLGACERAIPVSESAVDELLDVMPDVVLVSRLVDYGSVQVDYVRAAQYLGIPVGLPVASWDNLTNKGLMRVLPDFVTVWNEFQKREAVELHGMAEDRVWVTGAQTFDVWFDRAPSLEREVFCRHLGFDPQRPIIVYLCSSRSIGGNEVDLVRRWLRDVRNHDDPLVHHASVIVRPHPSHSLQWKDVELSEFGAVNIWPRAGEVPITDEQRNDFFNTLYHAGAIVGLNTSAQIEAAIIGRPVLVLIHPEVEAAREGTLETLHFRYLSDPERGIATVAHTTEEHLAHLSEALRRPMHERGRKFVSEFVRPHGVGRPAAPFLADALERGATTRTRPEPASTILLLVLRALLYVVRPHWSRLVGERILKRDMFETKPWLRHSKWARSSQPADLGKAN